MVETKEAATPAAESAVQSSDRIRASGDSEVSTYLEIAEAREPGQLLTTAPSAPEAVVVLDYGSQYSMLIARRIREAGVYSELVPWDTAPERLSHLRVKGFVLSGGPASVYDEGAPLLPPYVIRVRAARPRHLLRDAAARAGARWTRGAREAPRVRPRRHHRLRAGEPAAARPPGDAAGLDVALGTASSSCRRASARSPTPTTRRSPRWRTTPATSGSNSTRRSCTLRRAASCCTTSSSRSPGAPVTGRPARSSTSRSARSRTRSGAGR